MGHKGGFFYRDGGVSERGKFFGERPKQSEVADAEQAESVNDDFEGKGSRIAKTGAKDAITAAAKEFR